ncbi:Hypothetical protein, putative, partial [Bodo saltans]
MSSRATFLLALLVVFVVGSVNAAGVARRQFRSLATILQTHSNACASIGQQTENTIVRRCQLALNVTTCSVAACGGSFPPTLGFECTTAYGADATRCGSSCPGLMRSVNATTVQFPGGISSTNNDAQTFVQVSTTLQATFLDGLNNGVSGWQYATHYTGVARTFPAAPQNPDQCATADPRQSNWFVTASTGPKDIVFVLDVSGSMGATDAGGGLSRIQALKNSMYVLLASLTPADYVNVVTFSTYARVIGPSSGLVQATPGNVTLLRNAVAAIGAGGNTYFTTAFATAFPVFTANPTATSGCRRMMIFLTDGVTQNAMSDVYATVALRQATLGSRPAIFFTYSLSSASDDVIPQYLACTYNGIWAKIQNGANPTASMSQYYQFLALGMNSRAQRWTAPYNDSLGLGLIVTVSQPFYDNTSGANIFAGVAGVDVLMADLLATGATYNEIMAQITALSNSCPTYSLSACQMAILRSNSSFTCPNSPALSTCTGAGNQISVPFCNASMTVNINNVLCSPVNFTNQSDVGQIGQCCRMTGCNGYNPSPVNWTIPSSVYVGNTVQGTVSISVIPDALEPLSFALVTSPIAGAVTSPNLPVFTSNTSLKLNFTIFGAVVGANQRANLSIVLNTEHYRAPASLNITVKPLESIAVSGIPSQIYVNQSVTVTLTLTAAAPAGTLALTPTGSGVTFSDSSVTFSSTTLTQTITVTFTSVGIASVGFNIGGTGASYFSASTTLTQTITVTFTSVGIASVGFNIGGTGASYFSAITALSTNVYALQAITATFPSFTNGAAFVYISQSTTLTVSLGNPPITRTTSVIVSLAYADGNKATLASTLTFAVGVNSQTITVTGTNAQASTAVLLTIVQGSNAFVVATPAPTLTVLPLIPIALQFTPATQLVVVDRTLTLSLVVIGATTSLAGPVIVSFSYGAEATISSAVTFAQNSSTTTATVTITGVTAVAAKDLTVTLSGAGASTYSLVQSTFTFPVLTPRYAFVASATPHLPINGTGVVTFQLETLPTLQNDQIVVSLLPNAYFTWASSTVSLFTGSSTAQVTIVALAAGSPSVGAYVTVSSTTGEYASTLRNSSIVQIIAPSAITVQIPTFVYFGNTVQGSVSVAQLPPPTSSLGLTFGSNSNLGFTALSPFVSTSLSLSQTFNITGLGQGSGAVCQLSINPANAYYSAIPAQYIDVRPLETVVATGIPTALYAGQTATVTITISRAPAYAGTSLIITPQSSFGTFSPATVTFTPSTTTGTLTASVTFTAGSATTGATASFSNSGTAASIFTQAASSTFTIYPKETVSLTIASANVDSTSGFVYVQNSVVLTVSLGTPIMFHQQVVSVQLSYAVASKVNFSSTVVTFQAGINSTTVTIGGLSANAAASISASVILGADVFQAGSPASLRVLPLIPIAVQFNPATQLVVVNRTLTLTVSITGATTSLVGPAIVSFAYGSQVTFSSAITFAQNSATTTATFTITGVTAVAAKTLTVSLSGTGASTYNLTQSTFVFPVLAQRYVQISAATDYMVVDTQGSATFALASQPTLANDVIVLALTNSNGITWSATSITLYGSSNSANVAFTASTAGSVALDTLVSVTSTSTEYANALSNSRTVVVRTLSSISWSVPSFVYVNLVNTSSITVSELPPSTTPLQLALSATGVQFSTLSAFTSTSSATQSFSLTGVAPATSVSASVSIVSGGAFYALPAAELLDIRGLETIVATGIPTALYAGQTATVTITISRAPAYAATSLIITPQSTAGTFSPATVTFTDASTVFTATVTFTASSTGTGAISFTTDGSAADIFTVVTSSSFTVYPKESVTMSLPSAAVDSTSGFVYVQNSIELTVSLGTPAIYHQQSVSVLLSYADGSKVTFSANPVVFAAGVNSTTVTVGGLLINDVASLSASVVLGSDAFQADSPASLRVLPLIPIALQFDPATQLVVVGRTVTLTLAVTGASTSLVGPVEVDLSFGPEVTFSTAVIFAQNSSTTTATVQITGLTAVAAKSLTVSLTGIGATTYTLTQSTYTVAVLPQQNVVVASFPQTLAIGETENVVLQLGATPTSSADVITVNCTSDQRVSFSNVFTLSASATSVTVPITGTGVGATDIAALCRVTSLTGEFADFVAGPAAITVRSVDSVAWSVPPFVYVGQTGYVSISLSSLPPSSNPLTLIPTIGSSSVTLGSIATFTSTGSLSQNISMNGVSVASSVQLSLAVANSNPFYTAPSSAQTQVRALETISVTGFPTQGLYIGQSVNITITLTNEPQYAGTSLIITPTSSTGSFSPAFVTSNYGDATKVLVITYTATASGAGSISFGATGAAAGIYAPITALPITIFGQETVSLSVAPAAVDSTSGFVYVQNSIVLTVSLGTPAIYHQQSVSVQLSYVDGSKVTFSANPVVFAAGVNSTTVTITGVAINDASNIVAAVTQAADVFQAGSPAS